METQACESELHHFRYGFRVGGETAQARCHAPVMETTCWSKHKCVDLGSNMCSLGADIEFQIEGFWPARAQFSYTCYTTWNSVLIKQWLESADSKTVAMSRWRIPHWRTNCQSPVFIDVLKKTGQSADFKTAVWSWRYSTYLVYADVGFQVERQTTEIVSVLQRLREHEIKDRSKNGAFQGFNMFLKMLTLDSNLKDIELQKVQQHADRKPNRCA